MRVGDAVTLLGSEGRFRVSVVQRLTRSQIGAYVAGTISYSVLCGISARVKRVYVD